jgi:hypothetical protein
LSPAGGGGASTTCIATRFIMAAFASTPGTVVTAIVFCVWLWAVT